MDEYISRQAVLDAIDEIESEVADGDGFQYEKWRQYFCDLPSVDIDLSDYSDRLWRNAYERGKADAEADRKKGKWIRLDMHAHLADHKCTACGQECYVPTCMGEPMYAFCPNCGAEMKGADNGTD